jgi:hypothetical protein
MMLGSHVFWGLKTTIPLGDGNGLAELVLIKASHKRGFIADPNSCVQAVIDGQRIALWGRAANPEANSGHLHYPLDNWLHEHGYYVRVSVNAQKIKG